MRNFYPIFIIILLVFSFTGVHSQSEDKTHDLSPFKISVSIYNFERLFVPMTAGVMVEGVLKDKLYYNVQVRKGYVRNFFIPFSDILTKQRESKGFVFEGGAEYYFSEKMKSGKVRITTGGGYNYTEYFNEYVDKRVLWGLGAGVHEYSFARYFGNDPAEFPISNGVKMMPPDGKFYHTNQSTSGIYVGITHRKTKKGKVANGGYNYFYHYSTRFYIQGLFGLTASGPMLIDGKSYTVENMKQSSVGYRVGWQWDQMSAVTNFEFGKWPYAFAKTEVARTGKSPVNSPYFNFVRLTFHFNVFQGDKTYHLKRKKK